MADVIGRRHQIVAQSISNSNGAWHESDEEHTDDSLSSSDEREPLHHETPFAADAADAANVASNHQGNPPALVSRRLLLHAVVRYCVPRGSVIH